MIDIKFFAIFLIVLTVAIVGARIDWHRVKPLNIVPNSYYRTTIYDLNNDDDDDDSSRISTSSSSTFSRFLSYDNVNYPNHNFPFNYEQNYRRHGAMKRIFGGNVALHSTFPYQVGLLLKTPRGLNWCGGSLISHDYVITAAHCLDTATKALVFLGSYEIKNKNEPGSKRIEVLNSHFIVHPGWNPRRLMNDIALLRFPSPIEFTDSIQPIKLPNKKFVAESFAGKYATASGWGRFSSASPTISYSLRYVELPVMNQASCLSSYPFLLQSSNICTSGSNGKSTCTGDSGGPLVLDGYGIDSHTKILIGLTSFGSIFGCEKGYPGVYTRITSYLDWISDITGIGYHGKSHHSDDDDNDNDDENEDIEKNKHLHNDDDDDEHIHDRFDSFNNDEHQFQKKKRKR